MNEASIILVSCAGRAEAERIGSALVDQRLAACVHLRPHATIYRWNGAVERADEVSLLIKTVPAHVAASCALVRQLHSYALPAIVTLSVAVDDAVLAWLDGETGPGHSPNVEAPMP